MNNFEACQNVGTAHGRWFFRQSSLTFVQVGERVKKLIKTNRQRGRGTICVASQVSSSMDPIHVGGFCAAPVCSSSGVIATSLVLVCEDIVRLAKTRDFSHHVQGITKVCWLYKAQITPALHWHRSTLWLGLFFLLCNASVILWT